ncbi:MAG: hypothetical protein NTY36_12905 [Deltaproteobacteria bacterium]|nr:hypothetical protein [Deltaproteobacteria bacterium]
MMDKRGGKSGWWLALMLAVLVGAGCSGVLYEFKHEDGREDRLKVDQAESWSTYDDKPRKPDSRAKKDQDARGLILKQESTF